MTVMDKTCLIKQPAGLGDIFFLQKIADYICKKDYHIIWPVLDHYTYISDYLVTSPNIEFVSIESDFYAKELIDRGEARVISSENFKYLPIQDADRLVESSGSMMFDKYNFFGIDWNDWVDYFVFKRNYEREKKLEEYLGINGKFNLINDSYGSLPNISKNPNIKINNDYPNIEIKYLGFDNVFDWCGVFEKAEEIHTVETSFCYILSKLGLKNVSVYERQPHVCSGYSGSNDEYIHREIFSTNWSYYTYFTQKGF